MNEEYTIIEMTKEEMAKLMKKEMAKPKYTKEEICCDLGKLLKKCNVDISEVYLRDNDTAVMAYDCGTLKPVNIAGDSHLAIIKDVLKSIDY